MVTSHRCGSLTVDSTGRYPSKAPTLTLSQGAAIHLMIEAQSQPADVEVRVYAGAGISGSFLKWPEQLPTGVEPLGLFEPAPSLAFQYVPPGLPGEYSLVVGAAWSDGPS